MKKNSSSQRSQDIPERCEGERGRKADNFANGRRAISKVNGDTSAATMDVTKADF